MNPASEDVKDMLEAVSSLGLVFATNLFIGREPDEEEAAECITIYDTPGAPAQLTLAQGEDYYYPSIQIRLRNNSYLDGYTLAKDIMIALHAQSHETWNGTLYTLIKHVNGPFLLSWGENNRVIFITNFNLQRR